MTKSKGPQVIQREQIADKHPFTLQFRTSWRWFVFWLNKTRSVVGIHKQNNTTTEAERGTDNWGVEAQTNEGRLCISPIVGWNTHFYVYLSCATESRIGFIFTSPTFAMRLSGSLQEGGSADVTSCVRSESSSCCTYSSNMDASWESPCFFCSDIEFKSARM